MEAACFVTSKPFGKTPDLVPPSRTRATAVALRGRRRHCSLRRGGASPSSTILCCSRGSSSSSSSTSPDDNREPAVVSDWRSFRARLVAAERAAARAEVADEIEETPAVLAPLGDKWAHTLHEPEKGCLLIATERLDGVHIFERTVILLLSAGPAGTTGVILNRPSLMSIKETRSVALDVEGTFSEEPLFFGGPLEEGVFLVSPGEGAKAAEEGMGGVFEEVMEGVYYGTKESVGCAAEMVKRGVVGVGDFRFFDGYCGWERGQLMEEIRAGYWTVVACSASVVAAAAAGVAAGGGAMWEDVLGLVGERKVW
ncbi:hypothetical protein Taro_033122 [Colocasia esculenta]|uniref:Uncharacterized protein n=1 Tax=Colocasia esculenta TaxID=4460 RepID=A0A843VT18_COLES|nr:hypothetical protein [Colocasia esculenta]